MISLQVRPQPNDMRTIESTLLGIYVEREWDAQVSVVIGQDSVVRWIVLTVEYINQADHLRTKLQENGLKVAYS